MAATAGGIATNKVLRLSAVGGLSREREWAIEDKRAANTAIRANGATAKEIEPFIFFIGSGVLNGYLPVSLSSLDSSAQVVTTRQKRPTKLDENQKI